VLRALAKNWMPLLLNAFLATPPVQRTQLEEAVSAYACCCEPATLAQFFRAVVTKLIKVRRALRRIVQQHLADWVDGSLNAMPRLPLIGDAPPDINCWDHRAVQVTQQAQTGELGPGAVLEGGDTDGERRSTFLELSLALAGGLDAAGLETLYKAAKPGIQASHRRCYLHARCGRAAGVHILPSHRQVSCPPLLAPPAGEGAGGAEKVLQGACLHLRAAPGLPGGPLPGRARCADGRHAHLRLGRQAQPPAVPQSGGAGHGTP
jgi:hypothetical protein